jgi:TonB family protein
MLQRKLQVSACATALLVFASCTAIAQSPTSAESQPPTSASQGGGVGSGAVYKVGGKVSPPRAIPAPDPDYSPEALRAHLQGTVVLWLVVGEDGKPHNIRVSRHIGYGLDERAVATVNTWSFQPATKDGQPVAVQINVEVNFRLGEPLNALSHAAAFVGVDRNQYPLIVEMVSSKPKPDATGTLVKTDVRITEGNKELKLKIWCRKEDGGCFNFAAGYYPGRWSDSKLVVLGQKPGTAKDAWIPAYYTVGN